MGIGDSIKGAILDQIPGDAVRKITSALSGTTAGTTSGLDAAMQAHADQQHPVGSPGNPNAPGLNPKAAKYKLRLPSDYE